MILSDVNTSELVIVSGKVVMYAFITVALAYLYTTKQKGFFLFIISFGLFSLTRMVYIVTLFTGISSVYFLTIYYFAITFLAIGALQYNQKVNVLFFGIISTSCFSVVVGVLPAVEVRLPIIIFSLLMHIIIISSFLKRSDKNVGDTFIIFGLSIAVVWGGVVLWQPPFLHGEVLLSKFLHEFIQSIGGLGLTIGLLIRIILEHKSELSLLTLKDDLSELANRRSLNSYVDQLILKERPFQLALIRVKGIRQLNENYGHQAGDEALINVCEKLQLHLIKEGDGYSEQGFLARLSGNYLVYINSATNNNLDIEAVLSDLLNQISSKGISLQIGVACYPHHGSHFVEVLTAAEMVLSEYKSVKTNLVQKIDSNKLLECRSQQAMAYALIKAINTEEIEVYYQPKYTLNSSATSNEPTLIAAEALARWTYQGENVPPIIFIQLAEDYDLIGELDALVMKKSWLKACALSKSGHSLKIAVNYSSSSMEKKDKLIQLVESLMSNYQLEPTLLEIEITESAMAQSGNTHEQLQALRNLGISIAIDDFGTGLL